MPLVGLCKLVTTHFVTSSAFLNTDWKMIQLIVTCLFFVRFWRVKCNLKYVCCLLINFLGLVLRLKPARDSFVLKSSAQFEGH